MVPACLRAIIATYFYLLTSIGYGQDAISLQNTSTSYRLDSHVAVLADSTESLTIAQILTPEFQGRFRKSDGDLTFGYLKSSLWLKVVTRNESDANWYLEIPAPFLEYVDFYQQTDNVWLCFTCKYFMLPKQVLLEVFIFFRYIKANHQSLTSYIFQFRYCS